MIGSLRERIWFETLLINGLTEKQAESFVSKIKFSKDENDCFEWTAYVSKLGYGSFTFREKYQKTQSPKLVHRMIGQIFLSGIPQDCVCHKCDNRKCVNPNHLFYGSQKSNMEDMVKKGRSLKGSSHNNSKLTEEKVRQIKFLLSKGERGLDISRRFNVSKGTISYIKLGKIWSHV